MQSEMETRSRFSRTLKKGNLLSLSMEQKVRNVYVQEIIVRHLKYIDFVGSPLCS